MAIDFKTLGIKKCSELDSMNDEGRLLSNFFRDSFSFRTKYRGLGNAVADKIIAIINAAEKAGDILENL